MIKDYKNRLARKKRPLVSQKWRGPIALASIAMTLLLLALQLSSTDLATDVINATPKETTNYSTSDVTSYAVTLPKKLTNTPPKIEQATPIEPVLDAPEPVAGIPEVVTENWQNFTVKPGYNLAIIASRAGIKASEIHAIMQLGEPVAALKKLFPKDTLRMDIAENGILNILEYDIDEFKKLVVKRTHLDTTQPAHFTAYFTETPKEIRKARATGIIDDSLFRAAQNANLSDKLAIELANIFAWDIDFGLEVRKGDSFAIIYEEVYRDGEKISNGTITAAEFTNQGTTYRAIRYTTPDGNTDYYAPDGSSLRKAFMRNPVDFTRISSRFNLKRRHPILNKIRAHKGVDYAAPTGTPIKAVGDGKVKLRKTHGGYGRTIVLQHGQRYSTLYAHMSSYAKNIRVGSKVKQGQVIGYIGKSGLATGPHLHYEFRVDGVHRNPLTIKHPSVEPIAEQYKTDFLAAIEGPLAELDTIGRLRLAMEDSHYANPL